MHIDGGTIAVIAMLAAFFGGIVWAEVRSRRQTRRQK